MSKNFKKWNKNWEFYNILFLCKYWLFDEIIWIFIIIEVVLLYIRCIWVFGVFDVDLEN